MSFDRFPTDISMEVLPDEAWLPKLASAQDLLEWVAADSSLSKQQRVNELSAIRALSKVDDTPLDAIPLDPAHLLNVRFKAIRADKVLKKRRRSEIISLLNRTLKRAGIIRVGSKRSGKVSHGWIELLQRLSKEDQRGLSTLSRYCSGLRIEPHQVTPEVWHQFVDETLHATAIRRPRATVWRAARAANRGMRTIPGWPLPELPKLPNPRLFSLAKERFPESFWADLDLYAGHAGKKVKSYFDKHKTLSPDTIKRYRDVAWRTASAQVHAGRPANEIVSVAALIEVRWAHEAMRWLHARAGNKFIKDHLNIAATWVSFAKNYVHPPHADVKALREDIMDRIAQLLGPAEFSQRNIERLDQFSDAKTALEFQLMSFRIFDEVRRKKVISVDDATLMMAGVAHELLLATMVRLKNLADIDLKKHFWPAKPRPDGTWAFRVKAETVKNHKDLDFKLSKHTSRLIQFFVKECRPLLMKSPTDWLFLRADGTPKGREMMANLVVSTVRRRLHLDVNVHLYRHIGAMLFLDKHPGALDVVRIMLGHKEIRTTQNFYARLKATEAIRLFTEVVLGQRDSEIEALRLGWKRKP